MVKLTSKYKQPKTKRSTTMPKAVRATVDFQLLDNGTVRFTITPVDTVGNAASLPAGTPPLSATVVDATGAPSTLLSVAIDTANDTTGFGLVQIGTPSGALATGLVVTFSTTLPGATAPTSATANAIDVISGGPSGFQVAES